MGEKKDMRDTIVCITGREILNAKGKPTVEAEVITNNGIVATASVPSGTSTGKYEAFELYDGGPRYQGFGTKTAANTISGVINKTLTGLALGNPADLDKRLIELDGTENKSRLGANAILATSMALYRANALSLGIPLFKSFIPEKKDYSMPRIIATVISGGIFSPSGLEFEDYLYILDGFDSFSEELEGLVSLRWALEKNLRKRYGIFPEDGGALAAPLESTVMAFDIMLDVAKECGYEKNIRLGIDVAASELYDEKTETYTIGKGMSREELCDYYQRLCTEYPLSFIEDGFSDDDVEGFRLLKNKELGIQVVGDDLFASNIRRLQDYSAIANGLLLKINQIGTVTEAIQAAKFALKQSMDVIVSVRSGETTDDFIADLSLAVDARQIKLGSPVRAERNVKYNRLLRIAEELKQ